MTENRQVSFEKDSLFTEIFDEGDKWPKGLMVYEAKKIKESVGRMINFEHRERNLKVFLVKKMQKLRV